MLFCLTTKINFELIVFSNPTPTKDPSLQNIIWPKVDAAQPDKIQYLNMNNTFEIRSNPRYYQKVIKVLNNYITNQ